MARLKYTNLLMTEDSAPFAKKVYKCLRRLMRDAYNNLKLSSDEREDIRHFLDNGTSLLTVEMEKFNNRELKPKIAGNVRGRDVQLIHSFAGYDGEPDPNIGYMKLFLIHDALWRAAVNTITDVMPYIPYLRQDRKDEPRAPISAEGLASLTQTSANTKLSRVLTVDLHAAQEQGFYKVPLDALDAIPVFAQYIKKLGINESELTIVSPDAGGVPRAKKLAEALGLSASEIAMIVKERPRPGESSTLYVVGNVKKNVIEIDDLLDTGGTVIQGAKALRERGAKDVYVCATHAVLSPRNGERAEDRIKNAGIKTIVTDTIPRPPEYYESNKEWMGLVSMAPFFADAIFRTQRGESSGPLFRADYVGGLYEKFLKGPTASEEEKLTECEILRMPGNAGTLS